MKKQILILIASLFLASNVFAAKIETASPILTGTWDFGGGTVEVPNSNTLPATCVVGQFYMDTDATTGQRMYACESANTWALQGGGGGGAGDITDVGDCSTGVCYSGGASAGTYMRLYDGDSNYGAFVTANLNATRTYTFGNLSMTFDQSVASGATPTFTGTNITAAATATALVANGANCSAGNAPLGVDASGASESCTDFEEEVTEGSLADSTILSADIKDLEIVNADLSATAAIAYSKLAALTSGNILVGSAGTVATSVAMSGDVAIIASGATTIQADSVALGTDTTGNYAGSGSEGGAATTATALAANGANCSAGSFPLGVDASGASESCTASALAATTITVAGTALDITSSAGAQDLSANRTWTLSFDRTATLAGNPALAASYAAWATTGVIFEGLTADDFEGLIASADVTADRTWTLPNRSGTASLSGDTFTGDVTGTLDSSGATALTVAADSVALTTDTTGNYVTSLVAGTAIDVSAASEGGTPTIDFDSTEVEATTWGAGGNASNIWTFNLSGTDPTITFGSALVTVTGGLTATANIIGVTGTFSGLVTANASFNVANGATTAGVLKLLEDTDDGANFATFQVPALAANTVYTLPVDDGTASQVLLSDGSGTLSWVSAASIGGQVWTTTSNVANLLTSTDNVTVGSSTNLAKFGVDGDTDEIQALIQGHSTQTSNLVVFENSAGTDQFTLGNTGNLVAAGSGTFGGTAQSTITEGVIVNNGSGTDEDDDFTVNASGGTYEVDAGAGTFIATTNDLGWTIQSAANQACTTTCTSACVVGQNTATFALVSCSDATADACLCAGAS